MASKFFNSVQQDINGSKSFSGDELTVLWLKVLMSKYPLLYVFIVGTIPMRVCNMMT